MKANGFATPIIPPAPMPDFTEVFDPQVMMQARAERKQADAEQKQGRAERQARVEQEARSARQEQPRRRGIDVGAVITRALTAAGLMK